MKSITGPSPHCRANFWKVALCMLLSAALFPLLGQTSLQPGSVTLDSNGSITAIAGIGLSALTCRVLPVLWSSTDNALKFTCKHGATPMQRGMVFGTPAEPSSHVITLTSGDQITITATHDTWSIVANGTALQGLFPQVSPL